MKLFSKVAATFWHPVNPGEAYSLKALAFDHGAPAWLKKDPLFTMLVKDGNLEVITSPKQQKKLEENPKQTATKKGEQGHE